MHRAWMLVPLVPLCALASCSNAAQFRSAFAAGAHDGPRAVSYVGVLRDGALKPEGWTDWGEKLLASLGKCAPVYTTSFTQQHADAAKVIDKYTRENGISDELLELLAVGAESDAIAVVEVAGQPPKVVGQKEQPQVMHTHASGGGMHGMGPKTGSTGGTYALDDVTDGNAFIVVFSVYSAKAHATIARLEMTYTGQDLSEAVTSFDTRVRELFPGWSCAGWRADMKVDAEAFRKLP